MRTEEFRDDRRLQGVADADARRDQNPEPDAGEINIPEQPAGSGAEDTRMRDDVAADLTHPVLDVDRDQEDENEENDDHLRRNAETEPGDEKRNQDDARQRVAEHQKRIEIGPQCRRQAVGDTDRHADHQAGDVTHRDDLQRGRDVPEQAAVAQPVPKLVGDHRRAADRERVDAAGNGGELPQADHQQKKGDLEHDDVPAEQRLHVNLQEANRRSSNTSERSMIKTMVLTTTTPASTTSFFNSACPSLMIKPMPEEAAMHSAITAASTDQEAVTRRLAISVPNSAGA